MADTLLIDLFKQLGSIAFQLAKQEINLLVGVDEEVQKLQDRLGFIKAMLDDAEERHAVKQRTEKLWLEKLQNQYYEMDDILDTWSTARIRAEIEKEEGKPADTNAPAVVKKKELEISSWDLDHRFSKNITKETERTGTRFLTSLTSNWAMCMCKEADPSLLQRPQIKTMNLGHNSLTKMMLGLARLSVWWMNEWKWTMMRVRTFVKQTENKSKVLKWTRFLKTTEELVDDRN
ncbi:hypothetical protein CMV_024497 [Castanea mollissima]|uniref:Disease resistance N-terminal domain-containing protein n=1 Tax=Castanea mollissima TaxID=60419 RepID=A0A8J4VHX3_9ROSI|nr:hypothetical protein CMV_024497 [Castanea mollissima]